MTKSEEILAKRASLNEIVRVTDVLGRLIGVKRLKPSQQLKIEEMSPNLSGMTDILVDAETGKTAQVPKRMPLIFAASVCEIDQRPLTFPKNRGELDSVLDMLDEEGIAAVADAFGKIIAKSVDVDTEVNQDPVDLAKNM
jgi:hypothetical protein